MSTNEINAADVYSAYIDADGSLFLYDKEGKDLEGWPKGWPEHIPSVYEFLEERDIVFVNKPQRTIAELYAQKDFFWRDSHRATSERDEARKIINEVQAEITQSFPEVAFTGDLKESVIWLIKEVFHQTEMACQASICAKKGQVGEVSNNLPA